MIYCQIPERKPTVHIEELTVFVLSPRETVFSVLEIFIKAFLFKLGYNHSLLKKNPQWYVLMAGDLLLRQRHWTNTCAFIVLG